jgi:hypothetical protein
LLLLAVAALAACPVALAQANKCVDAKGKVTYTSKSCASIDKDHAGTVEDRLSVSSSPTPPPKPAKAKTKPKAATPATAKAPEKKAASEAPKRKCFQVKHVSGTSGIRCNDDPGVSDPVPTDERSRSENKAGYDERTRSERKAE